MIINNKEFSIFVKNELSFLIKKKIKKNKLVYSYLNEREYDASVKKIIKELIEKKIKQSGKRYKNRWEDGWGENYYRYKKTAKFVDLIPKYFFKEKISRIGDKFIKPKSRYYDYKILTLITSYVFEKYLKKEKMVIEFGCGTGHNLLNLIKFNKTAKLYGLDWSLSSQKILNYINKKYPNITGHKFNYFKTPHSSLFVKKLNLKKNNWCCFTVASLEQVGNEFKKYINFLKITKPKLIINIEPINELMNKNILLDYLSIKYCKKRNYLNGYFSYLKTLEKRKIIKFLEIKKSYFGSFYINGYSILAWKFLK
jgi:hypothetical protein